MQFKTEIEMTAAIRFAYDILLEATTGTEDNVAVGLQYDAQITAQGYRRRCDQKQITLLASDEAGAMYGMLDLAEAIQVEKTLDKIEDKEVIPLIKNRGIKFNIPLDARTPSYSDSSDSAVQNIVHMWEYSFWTEFLDQMAQNKYNVLSLWSMSPFPSMVQIPEYPLTALNDVKRATRPFHAKLSGWDIYAPDLAESPITVKKLSIEEKITFWQSVMEYAKSRCISIYLFTWNVFTYGTENSPYGITASQDNPVTVDYIYCAVKAMMKTYPLLAGIGVTAGEHMAGDESDIAFLAATYGRAIKEVLVETPNREFRLIHRMQMAKYEEIVSTFQEFPCPFEISFKYSQAHMYSNTRPHFMDEFLAKKDRNIKIWLTVRNDDYYMYRWGDPSFAREYLNHMPHDELAGFYMGADGYTWGRDYMDVCDESHRQFLDKMWYMVKIWGNLSYRQDYSRRYFEHALKIRFGLMEGTGLYNTWKEASKIISKVNCVHWQDYDFQWYPEGCCHYEYETDKLVFSDINEFIACPSVPGDEYYSVQEYVRAVVEGNIGERISPLVMAEKIRGHAQNTLTQVPMLRQMEPQTYELQRTLDDLTALANLGNYYAYKIEAAVYLQLYRLTCEKAHQQQAVLLITTASQYWHRYAAQSKAMYKPQRLSRLMGLVDLEVFNEMAELDILLAKEEMG